MLSQFFYTLFTIFYIDTVYLPLSDHRDTSLISRHCRSMTVARRMPARASTAVALRAYRAEYPGAVFRRRDISISLLFSKFPVHLSLCLCAPGGPSVLLPGRDKGSHRTENHHNR